MEQWLTFLEDRWYVVLIALAVILIVLKVVKTVVKWVLMIAVIAGVIYYGIQYTDKLDDITAGLTDTVVSTVKEQALKAIAGEATEAEYRANSDGTFTVETKSIRIDGKPGSSEVKVTFMGQSFSLKLDETVQKFIDQAKQNQ